MNILVIDDDASLRRTLRMSLEVLGHRAVEARDGTQALELLGRGRSMWPCWTCAWPRNRGWTCCRGCCGWPPACTWWSSRPTPRSKRPSRPCAAGRSIICPSRSRRTSFACVLDRIPHVRRLQSHVDELEEQVRSVVPEVDLQTEEPKMREALDDGLQDGGQRGHHSAARRKRHGQGCAGPGDPCPQPAGRRAVRHGPLSRASPPNCWRASCSATCKGRSPARCATRSARWRSPKAARCFSTKSATCR